MIIVNSAIKPELQLAELEKLERTHPVEWEESRDGKQVARVDLGGRKLYLGSRFAVEKDIQSMVDEVKATRAGSNLIVFGLGGGEFVRPVLDAFVSQKKLLIFESNPDILIKYLTSDEVVKHGIDPKLILCHFTPEDKEKIQRGLVGEGNRTMTFIPHPGYTQAYPQETKIIADAVVAAQKELRTSEATWEYFTFEWVDNPIMNMKYLPGSYVFKDFKDVHKGRPAVVVSAGPSLSKNIQLLEKVQDKFIIISGGHTLKALLARGIHPDYVVIVDAGQVAFEEADGYLSQTDAGYIYHERSPAKLFENYHGKRILHSSFKEFADMVGRELYCIEAGTSVAHSSANAALYMGCDPVIFIGQDLAYTNDRNHAEETVPEIHQELEASMDSTILEHHVLVEGVDGKMVKTSDLYNGFRKIIEQIIEGSPDTRFIDATEGGAKIKDTDIMTLQEAIDEYWDTQPKTEDIYQRFETIDDVEAIKAFQKTLLERYRNMLYKDVKTLHTYSKKFHNAQKRENQHTTYKHSKRLHDLEVKLDQLVGTDRMLMSLVYSTFKRIHHDDELMALGDETEEERLDKERKRRWHLYKTYELACRHLIARMEQAIEEWDEEDNEEGKVEEDHEQRSEPA